MAKTQAKGSATRILLDFETAPGTSPAFASRLPVILPFNSESLQSGRSLQRSATLRGDRSGAEPFQGFLDVAGTLTVPIDDRIFGYFLKLAMGDPVSSVDAPGPTADVKTGSPTVTISGGSGASVFSAAQLETAVGDRVIYESAGVRYSAYLTTRTNDTDGVLSLERDAATAAANVTAATVLYIVRNSAAATPGTVTISSNVATFSAAQANLAAGALVIYEGTSRAIVESVTSTTVATLKSVGGAAVANASSVDLEAIELSPFFAHTYRVHPTASNPTAVIELGFTDMEVPQYERFSSCKVDTIEISLGGEGELTADIAILGGRSLRTFQPYDKADHFAAGATVTIASGTPYTATFSAAQASIAVGDKIVYRDATNEEQIATVTVVNSTTSFDLSGAPVVGTTLTVEAVYPGAAADSIAMARFGDRFFQFDANFYLNGALAKILTETSMTLANNLDGSQYLIGNLGAREEIPEGVFNVSGSLKAVFKEADLIDKAKAFETVGLRWLLTRDPENPTGQYLDFVVAEAKMQEKSPEVDGPAGVVYDPTFEGFKRDATSILEVVLTGAEIGY